MTKMASLVLEDGTTFTGLLFGADVSVSGEVGEPRTHFLDSSVAGSVRLRTHLGSPPEVSLCCFFVTLAVICRLLRCHSSAKTSLVSLQQRGLLLAVTIVEGAGRHQQRLESILFLTLAASPEAAEVAASLLRSISVAPGAQIDTKCVSTLVCKYLLISIQLMCTCDPSHISAARHTYN